MDLGQKLSIQAIHDLRLALDLLLSRGWALVPGPWVADLTMRSMISSAASSPPIWVSSTGGVHACIVRPEQIEQNDKGLWVHTETPLKCRDSCWLLILCVTSHCHPHLPARAGILSAAEAPELRWPPCRRRWCWFSAPLSCARALQHPQCGPGPEAARSPGCH